MNESAAKKLNLKNGTALKLQTDELGMIEKWVSDAAMDLTAQVMPPEPAITYQGITIGSLGEFSSIIGKAKSRKTYLATMFAGAVLCGNYEGLTSPLVGKQVIYFDTEQGRYYVDKLGHRIINIAGNSEFLTVYSLRTHSPGERIDIIEHVLENTDNIGLVVIDGIRDLITSINDEEQASMINTKLLKWSEYYHCHITVVLHQNKQDNNARGHVGAELVNKGQTTMSVNKDEINDEMSYVKFDYCKDKNPESFGFTVNESDLPVVVTDWQSKATTAVTKNSFSFSQVDITTHHEILKKVFAGNAQLKYSELQSEIIKEFQRYGTKVGENKARDGIRYYESISLIVRSGTAGTSNSKYTLNDGELPF